MIFNKRKIAELESEIKWLREKCYDLQGQIWAGQGTVSRLADAVGLVEVVHPQKAEFVRKGGPEKP